MSRPFLFFDVGGTLLHFQPSFVEVIVEACAELAIQIDTSTARRAVARAMDEAGAGPDPVHVDASRIWWHRFFNAFLAESGHGAAGSPLVDELWRRHQAGDWLTPAVDTRSTLVELADAGYRLGIISNWDGTLEAILERRGLLGFFEVVIASADVGVAKPHPGIFSYAMARARVSPPRVVHVGDDPVADVEGAIGVGVVPVYLGSPSSLDGHGSVLSISTLGALPAALAAGRLT
jgi:putative hydrolase of the HAD superfamily